MSGDPRDQDNRGYGYGGYERPSRKREAPVGGDSNRDKRTGSGQVRRAGGSSGTKRRSEERRVGKKRRSRRSGYH